MNKIVILFVVIKQFFKFDIDCYSFNRKIFSLGYFMCYLICNYQKLRSTYRISIILNYKF